MSQPNTDISIYLNAGLFNAAERLHTLYLEQALVKIGYKVILPLREAVQFLKDGAFNLDEVTKHCQKLAGDKKNICVGSIDGTDADSGTVVEYTIGVIKTGRAINYRSDFRTFREREIGINAMLLLEGTTLVYHPAFFTDLREAERFYNDLALKIHYAVQQIDAGGRL